MPAVFPGKPSPEMMQFIRRRQAKLLPSFSWQDVWAEEHQHAFTVAKATTEDVLKILSTGVEEALQSGLTFRDFEKLVAPQLQKQGWWGTKLVEDPQDGQKQLVQLGSRRRLQVIYDTNARVARAAGQWDRIEQTKDLLPYLLYELGPSERHRPLHVSWAGTILPVDHPFWSIAYPPNGWGCKCRVRQITEAEAIRRGISQAAPVLKLVPYFNKRTGEERDGYEGIDIGWEHNVGKVRRAA